MKVLTTSINYHIPKSEIGKGNFGTVYLADDPQIGGKRALKIIPKKDFGDPAKFFAEAQAMFASEHANVVPIITASQDADNICLAMPYFQNGSLHDRIKDIPLQVTEVIRIGQDMLNGLSQIHIAKRVHFDVKPSNILFSDKWEAMVADFGQTCAIEVNGLAAVPDMYRYTRPPETLTSKKVSLQCDIYQAGVTLYRAVNGDPLWKGQIPAPPPTVSMSSLVHPLIQRGKLPNRDLFLPHVPKSIRTVLRKAMNVDPAQRYNSASAFAHALGRVSPLLDWTVKRLPGDGLEWTAARVGKPTWIVTLSPDGAGKWNVQLHTLSGLKKRARDEKGPSWRNGIDRKEADAHLKALFADLEQGHHIRQTSATQ